MMPQQLAVRADPRRAADLRDPRRQVMLSTDLANLYLVETRAFVRVRGVLAANRSLARKIAALEKKYRHHDAVLVEHKEVFDTMKKPIGAPFSRAPQEPVRIQAGLRSVSRPSLL
jgi:hypothetical protein